MQNAGERARGAVARDAGDSEAARCETTAAQTIARFDEIVDRVTDTFRSPGADKVFYSLSKAGEHSIIWNALGLGRAVLKGRPAIFLKTLAIMSAESALTNGLVKSWFKRDRPAEYFENETLPHGLRKPITSSFPSGHATSAFVAAQILSTKRTRCLYFAGASAVAYSRVYVKMHHGSDVIAGAALGLGLGWLARKVLPLK